MAEKKWYRVRKTWKDEQSQLGAFEDVENAVLKCPGGWKIFDPDGNEVFDPTQLTVSEIIDRSCKKAVEIANDNKNIGYDNSESGRGGGPGYPYTDKNSKGLACSSLVAMCYLYGGIDLTKAGITPKDVYTANIKNHFTKLGFTDVTTKVNFKTGKGLQAGDLINKPGSHIAIYIGNGQIVEAAGNEKGSMEGGKVGDQTGYECYAHGYYSYPWTQCLRLTKNNQIVNKNDTHYYRVRKTWKDEKSQMGSYRILDVAKRNCPAEFSVFDWDGKEVFNPMTDCDVPELIERATSWAIRQCNDDSIGYENKVRDGSKGLSCATITTRAYIWAGIPLTSPLNNPEIYTTNMRSLLLNSKCFEDITSKVNFATGKGLKKGDICLQPSHTAMLVTDTQIAQATSNSDGKVGDSSGQELVVQNYYNGSWKTAYRLVKNVNYKPGKKPEASKPSTSTVQYQVLCGQFKTQVNAEKRVNKIKKHNIDAMIVKSGSLYNVQVGLFSLKSNAQKMVTQLKNLGFSAAQIVKIKS